MEAETKVRRQVMMLTHGGLSTEPKACFAENLSAQGSCLCACQAKRRPHAPEIPAPPPPVALRIDIDGLTQCSK